MFIFAWVRNKCTVDGRGHVSNDANDWMTNLYEYDILRRFFGSWTSFSKRNLLHLSTVTARIFCINVLWRKMENVEAETSETQKKLLSKQVRRGRAE